jgi:toxin FitB
MIVLDSNVISALMRSPDPNVVRWLDTQPAQSLWTTSVCVFEIEYGIQSLPRGKRRKQLQEDFERSLQDDLGGRILEFDALAARHAAAISVAQRQSGLSMHVRDAMIAGTVVARNATLATRNVRHFDNTPVSVVNPWSLDSRK